MKNKVTQRVNSNSKKSILNAAEVILNGGIIVYPTDTLYGFGVDANNISAINKLNKLKGREGPISVVMQDINTIISCAKIDDVEVKHIQHENKIANERIEQAYYDALERLNKVQGFIIEGAMKKHKQEEDL